MKKIILSIVALMGVAFVANAQKTYNMKITKTTGEVVVIAADDVEDVTFEEVSDTPDNDPYKLWAGEWTMTFMDYDGIVVRDVTISLPEEGSEEYGNTLYVHAPEFLQGSNNYDFDWKMKYTYDEAAQGGTVAIIVDDNPVGKLNDEMNIFFRLDNLPESDDFVTGEYTINWTIDNINNGMNNRAADRSQTLYFVGSAGDTFQSVAAQLNIMGDARLKKK